MNNKIENLAEIIYQKYKNNFLDFPAQNIPDSDCQNENYLAILKAISKLGFIEIDAKCLALAWFNQIKRLNNLDKKNDLESLIKWPENLIDFKIKTTNLNFKKCPKNLGLYAILPDYLWIERMAKINVPTLQLRFKSENKTEIKNQIVNSIRAVKDSYSRLFINDYWQEAINCGAYGVHLGQEDLDKLGFEDLKIIEKSGLRLGISTHGYAEMIRALSFNPSYIALGAVFPTTLKIMLTVPQGINRLKLYANLLKDYPLVAIGGISKEQFPEILKTGVGSIAIVRALTQAENSELTARKLMSFF